MYNASYTTGPDSYYDMVIPSSLHKQMEIMYKKKHSAVDRDAYELLCCWFLQ